MNESEYDYDLLVPEITNLFDNLSDPNRKKLIGTNIDKILASFFDRISSEQLASALLSKYGSSLFLKKTRVVETVINQMSEEEAQKAAIAFKLSLSAESLWDSLINFATKKNNLGEVLKYFKQSNFFLQKKNQDNRQTSEKIGLEYEEPLISLGYPHSYQNSVKLELWERVKKASGKFFALLVMPTGSGKTRTAIEFMIDFIRLKKNANILWLVESPELAEQALQTFTKLWKLRGDRSLFVHRCFGKFIPEVNASKGINIVFGGFAKMNSLKEQNAHFYHQIESQLDLLMIDEAHFALAETYESLIKSLEKKNPSILKIGLTATPMRADDSEFFNLKDMFQNRIIDFKNTEDKIIENPIKYLQEKKFLAEIDIEYLSIPETELKETSKDLNTKILERIKLSVENRKQTIVFAMSKDHAIALDILFKYYNLNSACITGDTLPQDRQIFFEKFKLKHLDILINYDILATGIDLPKVDQLFLIRKFGQLTTAMQVLGRALRGLHNGGNERNQVISIKSNKQIINDPNNLYNLIKNMY